MHSSILLPFRRSIAFSMFCAGIVSLVTLKVFAQSCGGLGVPGDHSSSGTTFLLVYMQNDLATDDSGNPTRYQDVYVASNADVPDTVTITCKAFPKFRKVIFLPPHGSATYRLSNDPNVQYPAQDAIVEIAEVVDPTVFKVVSTAPITCYGMNNKQFTADAFLALPYNTSTPEYRVMAYYNSTAAGLDPMPSEFSVASFDNNNTVTIIPSAVTSSGGQPSVPMTFTLDSGDCVQIQGATTDILGDLTGSIVRSTSPVVVYGGDARTEAPTGLTINQGPPSRDHLCEAMPPLSTWGTSFVTRNFGRPGGDVLRVLASVDNTVVKINGKVWGAPLMANKFRDTIIVGGTSNALDNMVAVESSDPVLVGMIAMTADVSAKIGDPFLAIVPPLEQTYNDFTYFITTDTIPLGSYDPNNQFLIIATELSGAGQITIDNTTTPPKAAYTTLPFVFKNGKQYAITTVNQSPGIHRIISQNPLSSNGFTILAYGWGDVISYGYTAGQLLVPLKGIIALKSPTHSVAPSPGDSIHTPPSIVVRNILAEKIYFDSAKVSYSQNTQNIAVRLKKDISLETGTLNMAEEKTLELATSQPVQDVITGSVRIWYHSALWMNMMPVDFPFVITPQSQAGVGASSEQMVVLENYPNPVAGRTTVHFAIPSRAYASVKIYDALGRVARIVSEGMTNTGDQTVQVSMKGLIPGEYTLELISPELGINEHRKMIVIE